MFPAFCCAGSLFYSIEILHAQKIEKQLARLETTVIKISGNILTPPVPWNNQFRFLLLVKDSDGMKQFPPAGETFLCFSKEYPVNAHRLVFEGMVHTGEKRKNRYEFDERLFFRANGIAGKIYIQHIIAQVPPGTISAKAAMQFRQWLGSVLKLYRNPHHRAIIRASFTGEKEYIAPEIMAAFTRSGLIHLLALSGFNIAVLLAAVYCILAVVPVGGCIKHAAALVVLWMYFLFVGPIPSLTRAVIMATMIIFSVMLQRKNYPLQTLSIAGIVWLAFSPASLFQPGFQLSYGATFGILTLYPVLVRLYPGSNQPVADYIGRLFFSSLSVSCAAFLTTLPIILYHFGLVSFYGIFATIVAIPLMTGAMWLFFAALAIHYFIPVASNLMIACSGLMTDVLLFLAYLPDRIPASYCHLPAPYGELLVVYYVFIIIVVTINRDKLHRVTAIVIPLLLCAIPGVYLLHRHFAETEIVLFSCKRNASMAAIRFPAGHSLVICNGEERPVAAVLQRTVMPWARHHPGTRIRNIYLFNREKPCIDTNIATGQRSIHPIDTLQLSDTGRTRNLLSCRYVPDDNRLTVVMDYNTVDIVINKDHTCSLRNGSGALSEEWQLPVKIILKPDEFAVRSYE